MSLLASMNAFLKEHACYDVLPISYRLIVFDSQLSVKKALSILLADGVVSAPLWSSTKQEFVGMLTVGDYINLIYYYYLHKDTYMEEHENILIEDLRKKQHTTGLIQQHYSIHPMTTLYDAASLMSKTRAHRIPLVIENREIVSVITQYRLMKFIANNFQGVDALKIPLSQLKIGTYGASLYTAHMSTPVIDIISLLACHNISAVPIVDKEGVVLNMYDTIDVMSLVGSEKYSALDLPVSEAIETRPADYAGVCTCTMNDTLYSILKAIRKKRIYRLVVIELDTNKLVGVLSISDILTYFISL